MGTKVRGEAGSRLLLIDTCGEVANVALSQGRDVIDAMDLVRQRASIEIVGALRVLLRTAGWDLATLDGIGVVSGPGSFTGVRTGLAVAKGLSEAAALPLVAVSRLEVLALMAGLALGFAVLDAGRGELYVRDEGDGREFLCTDEALLGMTSGRRVVVAEINVRERLAPVGATVVSLHAGAALPLVLRGLQESEGDTVLLDTVLLDAYYLRDEGSIYARSREGAL